MSARTDHQSVLEDQGFTVFEQLLDDRTLDPLRVQSIRILDDLSAGHRARNRSQGSLIQLADHPSFASIIGAPALKRVFDQLGFADPRFSSGYLISKPAGGPPLFWHQDWWGWDDPISYTETIAQVFVMVYLVDTSLENGCLRVVPGSHRYRHQLHDAAAAHGEELSRADDLSDPLFAPVPGEQSVPVNAGDVIIGDARLLHAAHGNRSSEERGLLTLWFHPNYRALPPAIRATIRNIFDRIGADTDHADGDAMTLDDWPDKRAVAHLFPDRETAEAHPWCRVPNWNRGSGV